jgi:hypothetical protein
VLDTSSILLFVSVTVPSLITVVHKLVLRLLSLNLSTRVSVLAGGGDGLTDELGLRLLLTDVEGESDADAELDGDVLELADTDADGDVDALTELLGLWLALGLWLLLGLTPTASGRSAIACATQELEVFTVREALAAASNAPLVHALYPIPEVISEVDPSPLAVSQTVDVLLSVGTSLNEEMIHPDPA